MCGGGVMVYIRIFGVVLTILTLVLSAYFSIQTIVGHFKGNDVIQEAVIAILFLMMAYMPDRNI